MPSSKPVVLINHLMEPAGRITGITRYLFALLDRLARRDSFRYVLATTWAEEELPAGLRGQGIEVVTRPFVKSSPFNILKQMAILPALMRSHRAVLEFNCNPTGCFWPFWRRVITVHDLYYDVWPEDFPWRRRLAWKVSFPLSLWAASAVICVSEASKKHLARFHGDLSRKSVVIHEAGGLVAAEPEQAGEVATGGVIVPYALYVGNIARNKNPRMLAEALNLLEQRGEPIRVYHVGRDELGLLSDAQKHAGLCNKVVSLGSVSDAALAAIYGRAHCLVSTSLDEGFCLPIVEAQSCGVPVVCSDIPVLREVGGEGGLFFDPQNPMALADHLATIFHDEEQRAVLARRAGENASRFSWERAASETERLFREMIGEGTAEILEPR